MSKKYDRDDYYDSEEEFESYDQYDDAYEDEYDGYDEEYQDEYDDYDDYYDDEYDDYDDYEAPRRSSGKKSRRARKVSRVPVIAITVILVIAEIIFMVALGTSKMVPGKLMVVAGLLLVAMDAVVALLTWDYRYRIRMVVGILVAVLMLLITGFGGSYLRKTTHALTNMNTSTEVTEVGVYVLDSDTAQSVDDISGEAFGILALLDRDSTDRAIVEMNNTMGTRLNTVEYDGLAELMDGLKNGEVRAVILNSGFILLLEDMEGYEDMADQLREIMVQEIITEVAHGSEDNSEDSVVSFDEEGLSALESAVENAEAMTGCMTIYISGIDSRSGLIAKSRSDVNIIATVNVETRQILLVSTPRDYYVPLSISNGERDKLTHAGIYGIDVCIDTLEMLYNTNIDYYLRMNFTGFENIIDSLGGVTVYSPVAFESENVKGYSFVEGDNNLNGAAALAFARERYAFASGDRQRGKNQMAVIKGVVQKVTSPAILTKYTSVLQSLDGCFETTVPYDVMASLVRMQLDDNREWNIVSYSVDGTGSSQKPYSMSVKAYVMVPDESTVQHAMDLMDQVKNGEILEQE